LGEKTTMVIAELKIKCWKCGREEDIREILEDRTVDINLNKLCPDCFSSWMTKKELTIRNYPAPQ
jgi:NMD protein affecting ribosome stability and mRNA decay